MKSTAQFSFGLEKHSLPNDTRCRVSDELLEELARIYPEGKGLRSFFVRIDTSDQRYKDLRVLLAKHGYAFSNKMKPETPRSAMLVETMEYEKNDFGRAEWYELKPSQMLADYDSRDKNGLISNIGDRDYSLSEEENAELLAGRGDPRGRVPQWAWDSVAAVGSNFIVMGATVACAAAAAGFHVHTKPTTTTGILEWCPAVEFPVLSAACDFRGPDGRSVPVGMPRLCGHLVDGFVQDPVLKYDRDVLLHVIGHMQTVDVAKTKERIGNTAEVSAPIILVSRRLTEWLISRDEKLRWKPVELI